MKTATFASAATLLAASNAASVTLQTTKCLDSSISYGEQFSITLNTAQPVAKDLPSVCGLRIISASDAVDVRSIQCQAFRDVAGTQPGSAVFTYDAPALIATNPVQEKAIKCTITPSTYNTVEKRQATNSTISSALSSQTQSGASSSSGLVLSGLPTITSSLRVITSTATVGPSSGLPSSSANGTTPSVTMRPTPSTASSASPSSTGAAGQVGVGVGVAVGAVLAMFV